MKKFLVIIILFLCFSFNKTFAAGQIEIADFTEVNNAIVGQDFTTYIGFLYSGTEYKPKLNIISRNFPAGLVLSPLITKGSYLYTSYYSGIPEVPGNYDLTFIITDEYGALLTKKMSLNVEGLTFPEIILPDAIEHESYSYNLKFNYKGKGDIRMRLPKIPDGLYDRSYPLSTNNTFNLKLIPWKAGEYTIKIEATLNDKVIGSSNLTLKVVDKTKVVYQTQEKIETKTDTIETKIDGQGLVKENKKVLKKEKEVKIDSNLNIAKEVDTISPKIEEPPKKKWYNWIIKLFKK